MSRPEIEDEMYRIGGYVRSLAGMERERDAWEGNPQAWLLGVAAMAEIVRSSAMDVLAEYPETWWEADKPVDAVELVKRAALEAFEARERAGGGAGE